MATCADIVDAKVRAIMQREQPLNWFRAKILRTNPVIDDALLKDFCAKDPIVTELRSKPDTVYFGYHEACCLYSLFAPCLIPCQLCTPISLCCNRDKIEMYAAASHLILHENFLVYCKDECIMPASSPGDAVFRAGEKPLCLLPSLVFAMLLDEDIALEILPADMNLCGKGIYPVETLLVKYNGSVVAAIDGPTNAQVFLKAFNQQREEAIARRISSQLPKEALDSHRALMKFIGDTTEAAIAELAKRFGRDTTEPSRQRQKPAFNQNQQSQYDGPILVAEMVRDDHDPIQSMSVQAVSAMLIELGQQQHCPQFEKNNVDGSLLAIMDESALEELGVTSSLDRKKILAWISRQKGKAGKSG